MLDLQGMWEEGLKLKVGGMRKRKGERERERENCGSVQTFCVA
jgi:hypothetical protein